MARSKYVGPVPRDLDRIAIPLMEKFGIGVDEAYRRAVAGDDEGTEAERWSVGAQQRSKD